MPEALEEPEETIKKVTPNMISVIIPLYNSENSIIKSVESVLHQTSKEEIEIVIVNDGSSDNSVELLTNLIDDKNIKNIKLIHQRNQGVSSARNRGVKASSGEWLALLDSDDAWHPEKLEKQMCAIRENKHIKFIGTVKDYCSYPYFKKNKNKLYTLNSLELICKWHPHTSTALFKKDTFVTAGAYDEMLTHSEDGDLWLRIANHCDLYVLNENLAYTCDSKRSFGESGLSANLSKMHEGELHSIRSARLRNQIYSYQYILFYCFLKVKYIRRSFIVRFLK